jgi:hypothetical protein
MPDIRELIDLVQNVFSGAGSLVPLAIMLVVVAGFWKTLNKAALPPWGALVPIYNIILIADMAGRPIWWALVWIVLFFIGTTGAFIGSSIGASICWLVASIMWFIMMHDISLRFGKGLLFAVGLFLFLPLFIVILGFGRSEYR